MTSNTLFRLFFTIGLFAGLTAQAHAQQTPSPTSGVRVWEKDVRAVDSAVLMAGQEKIALWGIEKVGGMGATFMLSGRTTLDNAIGSGAIECTIKSPSNAYVMAQCTNSADVDLGLYMLQQGYVVVNRGAVYGTIFEQPYVQAETQARNQKLGVWAADTGSSSSGSGNQSWLLYVSLTFFVCVLAAFAFLTVFMLRGFRNVVEAQQQNLSMVERERSLKDKERSIFAMMLDSEIKANKSKIQAYLVVYDEMLKSLQVTDRPPKYKKSGDILQPQPALERAVFDRNTDKMDILGDRLSSAVIHFYARIKSNPEYVTIEPDMPLPDVVALVEKALKNASMLDRGADRLIDLFSQGGLSSQGH